MLGFYRCDKLAEMSRLIIRTHIRTVTNMVQIQITVVFNTIAYFYFLCLDNKEAGSNSLFLYHSKQTTVNSEDLDRFICSL